MTLPPARRAFDSGLRPARSVDEGLRLLRELQYWIGSAPRWWGRQLPELSGRSPRDYILERGDPNHLLRVVRNYRPL